MLEVYITGVLTGIVLLGGAILLVGAVERYRDRQDFLESRAALYDKARRDGRI